MILLSPPWLLWYTNLIEMSKEPTSIKRAVLEAARLHLRSTADHLRERINDLKSVTQPGEGSESASQTESRRGSDVELMESLSEQLEHVERDISLLDKIDPSVRLEVVQYGAVVHTDSRNLLVAASVEDFEANGRHYLGVSTKAPLIHALSGAAAGEEVDFNGTLYTIKEIL